MSAQSTHSQRQQLQRRAGQRPRPSNGPVYVHLPAGVKIKAVVAGKVYSMALTTTQRILTWGYNGQGELGNGSDNSSLVPVS